MLGFQAGIKMDTVEECLMAWKDVRNIVSKKAGFGCDCMGNANTIFINTR